MAPEADIKTELAQNATNQTPAQPVKQLILLP